MVPAVAVIARPEADLGACLEGLERAGADGPAVVRIGADGAAMARNRALAACDAEVLALVEDDVVVEPGWLAALIGAWGDADEALACAGGPLRASFPGGRPEWLSDDLLDALATVDLGTEPMAVDPLERTFHGGNVSFRTSALRAVGGFWPSRGHRDGRDWFSEEHEAQRELARAGWHATYVAQASAVRVVGTRPSRRAVLRRRLRYGAREALIGREVSAPAAVRQLASSAAGTPLAIVRGRPRVAMERATRVAESAGALVAGPLARADLQPVARETPFRASVPPPPPAAKRGRLPRRSRERQAPEILLYHRVTDRASDPLGMCVSPANFAGQLEVVKAAREPLPLAELASDEAPPGALALTFDDGYIDNLEHAAPALAAAGVPATLFVSTGHVAGAGSFWWDELEQILLAAPGHAAPSLELELRGQRRAFRLGSEDQRRIARKHLHAWLQPLAPDEIDEALRALRAWAGEAGHAPVPEPDRAMTPDGLRAFVGHPGLSAGAHTRSHRSLRHADPAAQEAEIAGSRDDLAGWLGQQPTVFSYPFGVPGADVDEGVAARVRAAGFSMAVTTSPGALAEADPFMLPRRVVPDLDAEAFEEWLGRAGTGRRRPL